MYLGNRHSRVGGERYDEMTQAWSPIGGITFYREGEHTSTLEDPAIGKIAESHSKSPAQVMLRWHLQEGRSVIPMIEVNLLGAISRALGSFPAQSGWFAPYRIVSLGLVMLLVF